MSGVKLIDYKRRRDREKEAASAGGCAGAAVMNLVDTKPSNLALLSRGCGTASAAAAFGGCGRLSAL